jgi:rod shape-determining protein MreD
MKTFLYYLLFAFIALSVQSSLLFKVTRPDIVLVLVVFYSLRQGQIKGMVYGALTGLLLDSMSGFIIGPNILGKVCAGYFAPFIRQRMFQWNIVLNTLVISAFSVSDIILGYVCLHAFAGISLVNRPFYVSIVQVVTTTVVGMIFYLFLNPGKNSRHYNQTVYR